MINLLKDCVVLSGALVLAMPIMAMTIPVVLATEASCLLLRHSLSNIRKMKQW